MTASQRPERVDRDALIEAARARLETSHWNGDGCGTNGTSGCSRCYGPSPASAREVAVEVLDAVLPLIADAIEAEADRRRASMSAFSWGGLTHDPASAHYLRRAARLVRSLGDEQ